MLEDATLKNVIILQTVLEEVRHLSHSVYKRLMDIVANYSKCFYVFVNVYHRYVQQSYVILCILLSYIKVNDLFY